MMKDKNIVSIIENCFHDKTVLVLGDLMIDEYITGKVSRISPEAPVPVLNFQERSLKAGGAANVAYNLNMLGCKVLVSGTAANDLGGNWLREQFILKGIDVDGILEEELRPTTMKTRYATRGQQLLRVDKEVCNCIKSSTQERILEYIKKKIDRLDGIVLSDYKKGVLEQQNFVESIIKICNTNSVIVAIDSKSRNISAFNNADFVKPNNLELEEAIGIKIVNEESLDLAGKKYLQKSGAKALIVTRGAKGISVFLPHKERRDFEAKQVQVFDVTGAGDTVISTIILSIICGIELDDAVQLANYAASIAISKLGTVAVSKDELVTRVNEK